MQTQTPPPAASTWPVVSLAKAHAQLTAPGQRFEIEEKVIRGVNTRTWKNAPATLRDIFLNMTPANDLEFRRGTDSPTVRIEGLTMAGS